MDTSKEAQRHSREAAELCHHDVNAMVTDARESFEIWRAFFYIGDGETAKQWVDLQWFNPFLAAIENAIMSIVIINLFILGDDSQKQSHSIHFFQRKLVGSGVLDGGHVRQWDQSIAEAKPTHDKLKVVRDKHLAHRDKGYTWGRAMQETGLAAEELNQLVTIYFRLAINAAELLELPYFEEQTVLSEIRKSIGYVRTALLEYQPKLQAANDG